MIILYGIKNCDTVKKARRWLDDHRIDYQFHDFRSDGIELAEVAKWMAEIGVEKLINKRSTTWKQLSETAKQQVCQGDPSVVQQYPTLIKRPLLDLGTSRHTGFTADGYAEFFAAGS